MKTVYDFGNLGSQLFERMLQTLSLSALNIKLGAFRGESTPWREATGTNHSTSTESRLHSSLFMYSLFVELPNDVEARDAWLIREVSACLHRYEASDESHLWGSTHLVVATNVLPSSLSARTQLDEILQMTASKVGSCELWDATRLQDLVDANKVAFTEFVSWICPSAILLEIPKQLNRPHLLRLMPLALARDIRNEHDVRIRDAGQESDRPIYLEDVFVDLPTGRNHISPRERPEIGDELDASPAEIEQKSTGAAHQLWWLLGQKLDPASVESSVQLDKPKSRKGRPNRIVILGGPGQGKSTLGQFVSQLLRARLLSTLPSVQLKAEIADVVESIVRRALEQGFQLGCCARFPIRVDLPLFADALKKATDQKNTLSLVTFIAERLSRGLDESISVDDLRAWLSAVPSAVILDGLDEVPPSSNRKDVIDGIDALLDEVHFMQLDLAVVVTSRPQGYSNDLNPQFWQHWQLRPLKAEESLRFAERLSVARLSDQDRRASVLEELRRACEDDSTSALMSSPLQVTIMFGIALLKGAIPQNRWDLFERYYSLLRDREAGKPTEDGRLIRDHRSTIDRIHQESGFLLQAMAEKAGGANAYLSSEAFAQIIARLLRNDEYADDQVRLISSRLAKVATDRLVLLAARIEDRISFDVRSLQEYMAAARMTAVDKSSLPARLRAIGFSAHWRHVLRISASRIFSDPALESFRSDVVGVCHSLNEGDDDGDSRRVMAGSRLAIELLNDGAQPPRHRKRLIKCAMRLFDFDIGAVAELLQGQWDANTSETIKEEVSRRLTESAGESIWQLAFSLLQNDGKWAEELILARWPRNAELSLEGAAFVRPDFWTDPIVERIRQAQWRLGAARALEFAWNTEAHATAPYSASVSEKASSAYCLPRQFHGLMSRPLPKADVVFGDVNAGISISFISIDTGRSLALGYDPPAGANGWRFYQSASSFLARPSKRTLVEFFESVKPDEIDENSNLWRSFPWVIASLLYDHQTGRALPDVIEHVNSVEFGDLSDWLSLERKWKTNGVSLQALESLSGPFFVGKVGEVDQFPFPVSITASAPLSELGIHFLNEALQRIRNVKPESRRTFLTRHVAASLSRRRPATDDDAQEVLSENILRYWDIGVEDAAPLVPIVIRKSTRCWTVDAFVASVDAFGRCDNVLSPIVSDYSGLFAAYSKNPNRRGLIAVIGRGVVSSASARKSLGNLPLSDLVEKPGDTAPIALGVLQVQWAMGVVANEYVSRVVEVLAKRARTSYSGHSDLRMFSLDGDSRLFSVRGEILRLLADVLARQDGELDTAEKRYQQLVVDRLAEHLQSKPSLLQDTEQCKALGLPHL